ncbi:MAG: HEAT repeat domain-containing protein, partial [Pseudomonadota bacterium]
MALFSGLKAERLISDVVTQQSMDSEPARKALQKLRKLGGGAVPKIIDALAAADNTTRPALVSVLTDLADKKNLKHYVEGMSDGNQRIVEGTAQALANSTKVDPLQILALLENEDVSKPAVLGILDAHKDKVSVRDLLTRAYDLDNRDKTALFRIIDTVVDEDLVPDLVARVDGKDATVKINLMNILGRFNRPDVRAKIVRQIEDPNKRVRQQALKTLAELGGGSDNVERIAALLLDGDLDV